MDTLKLNHTQIQAAVDQLTSVVWAMIELESHVIGDVPKEPAKDAGDAAKQDNA